MKHYTLIKTITEVVFCFIPACLPYSKRQTQVSLIFSLDSFNKLDPVGEHIVFPTVITIFCWFI